MCASETCAGVSQTSPGGAWGPVGSAGLPSAFWQDAESIAKATSATPVAARRAADDPRWGATALFASAPCLAFTLVTSFGSQALRQIRRPGDNHLLPRVEAVLDRHPGAALALLQVDRHAFEALMPIRVRELHEDDAVLAQVHHRVLGDRERALLIDRDPHRRVHLRPEQVVG